LALIAIPGIAAAHTGHHAVMSVASGLMHPFTGLDHLLAMLGVGVIAGRSRGPMRLWLPLCFLSAMAIGGTLAMHGLPLPWVETMLVVSVFLIAGGALTSLRVPGHLIAAMTALFAIFHGYAHGLEMHADASSLGYGAGYLTSAALLLLMGVAIGRLRPFAAIRQKP
jgi:urease accessory protein